MYIYFFIIIMFGLVCDSLGSPSDLVKSWGGGVTVACRVPRRGWAYGPQYIYIYKAVAMMYKL